MPLYVHPINLYIKKSYLRTKYPRGISGFLEDYNITNSEFWEEDNELISVRSMDVQNFDLSNLVEYGSNVVSGDEGVSYAEDFVIYSRHFNQFSWDCDWLEHNMVFAWHIDASEALVAEAKVRSDCPMNEIEQRYGSYGNFSKPITKIP